MSCTTRPRSCRGLARVRASQLELHALEAQERVLHVEPAAVAPERAITAQDAMTRKHDRDRVRRTGGAGGTCGSFVAGPQGKFAVADRGPVRHLGEPLQ